MITKAFLSAGYQLTNLAEEAMFLLIDSDVVGRARQIHQFYEQSKGARIFVYPHTGRPPILWDGIYAPSPYVTAVLGIGEGYREVMRRIGYSKPVHSIGWTMTRMKKFRAVKNPKRILFAPIHPNGNGYLSNEQREINRLTFEKLIPLVRSGQIELTVRYLHRLEWNNISQVQGVKYVQGRPDQSIIEIDKSHAVVSKQNMQYMAVARGIPTIGMGEDYTPISGTSSSNTMHVISWEKYREYMRYPIDILSENDTMEIIKCATQSDEAIRDWRNRFIGTKFDRFRVVEIVEKYL